MKIKSMSRKDFTITYSAGKYKIIDNVFDDIIKIGSGGINEAEKWLSLYIIKINKS